MNSKVAYSSGAQPVNAGVSAIQTSKTFGQPAQGASAVQQFGFAAQILLLFVIYSRFFDAYFSFLHVPAIAFFAVLGAALLSGAFARALSHPVGKCLLAFTLWAILSIPFSMYRRGSFDVVTSTWLRAMLAFVGVAGLCVSYGKCRRAANTIGYSMLFIGLLASLGGIATSGRLLIEGKYSNPNDLAQGILIGLPFLWLRIKSSKQMGVKLLFGAAATLILVPLMKTGSRGGLIAFLVMGLVLLKQSSVASRMRILFAAGLVAMAGLVLLPSTLIHRYALIFSNSEDAGEGDEITQSATGSSTDRRELLKRSISLTFRHPVFGVGPGEFSEASQAMTAYHIRDEVTHNSYTQVSSEIGIVALLFYLAALFYCVKVTSRIRKFALAQKSPIWNDVSDTASYLRLSVVAFAITAAFSSVAYQSLFPTLAGLVVALDLSLQQEMLAVSARATKPSMTMDAIRPRPMVGNGVRS